MFTKKQNKLNTKVIINFVKLLHDCALRTITFTNPTYTDPLKFNQIPDNPNALYVKKYAENLLIAAGIEGFKAVGINIKPFGEGFDEIRVNVLLENDNGKKLVLTTEKNEKTKKYSYNISVYNKFSKEHPLAEGPLNDLENCNLLELAESIFSKSLSWYKIHGLSPSKENQNPLTVIPLRFSHLRERINKLGSSFAREELEIIGIKVLPVIREGINGRTVSMLFKCKNQERQKIFITIFRSDEKNSDIKIDFGEYPPNHKPKYADDSIARKKPKDDYVPDVGPFGFIKNNLEYKKENILN